MIQRQLARGYPQHGVVGRYTPHREGEREGRDVLWRIEPFHGYSNLTVAAPGFALSLVCLVKGRPEHAVVICPFSDDEYLMSRGRGASSTASAFVCPSITRSMARALPWVCPKASFGLACCLPT